MQWTQHNTYLLSKIPPFLCSCLLRIIESTLSASLLSIHISEVHGAVKINKWRIHISQCNFTIWMQLSFSPLVRTSFKSGDLWICEVSLRNHGNVPSWDEGGYCG